MHLDLLIPALLWPHEDGAGVMRALAVPTLERWLARGRTSHEPAASGERWLWEAFIAPVAASGRSDLPIAPVTLAADGGMPGMRWWMRADPVHIIVGRTGLRLAPADVLDLSNDEAAALAEAIRRHFPQPRFALTTPDPRRWYLAADAPFGIDTFAPAAAAGDELDRRLPAGAQRLDWLRFMNEVQMLWFEHPVNVARERRGEPAASGLWLHGPGQMPQPGSPPYTATAGGDDGLLAGLATLHRLPWQRLPPDSGRWLDTASAGHWLIQFDRLARCAAAGDASGWREALCALERDWFVALERALRSGRIRELTLLAAGNGGLRRIRVRPADRLRIWRPVRALAAHA